MCLKDVELRVQIMLDLIINIIEYDNSMNKKTFILMINKIHMNPKNYAESD